MHPPFAAGGSMFGWKQRLKILLSIASATCIWATSAQCQKASRVTIEQLIEIKHPSDPVWSPDNKRVVFTWDRADIRNLYVANADGSGAPVTLTSFPAGGVADAFWSEDGESVYFVHESDLWKVPAAGGVGDSTCRKRSERDGRATAVRVR